MKTLETIIAHLIGLSISAIVSLMIGLALSLTIEFSTGYCHLSAIVEFALCVFPLFVVLTIGSCRHMKI